MTLRAAAAALNVAPATAHRWWHRCGRPADEQERRAAPGFAIAPHAPPPAPAADRSAEEEPILRARRETNLGPGRLAGICRRARSTIWKVLHRHGLSRRRAAPRDATAAMSGRGQGRCCTSTSPAWRALSAPGIAVTGDRTKTGAEQRAASATSTCTASIDDHSATPTSSSTPTERRHRGRCARAARSSTSPRSASAAGGGDERQRPRLSHVRAFAARCARRRRHILTPPYTPRWNGKVERFIQTLKSEWAYAHSWPSLSRPRTRPCHPSFATTTGAAPQLPGRPAADQPRSQRPWVGQLVRRYRRAQRREVGLAGRARRPGTSSTGSGSPRNRQAPEAPQAVSSGSDSSAAATAEDSTIWPPCAAKQIRAAAWTERPT